MRAELSSPAAAAGAILLLGGATILGALAFEHLGGYTPCALCLQQRWPYYLGLPLAALTALGAARGAPSGLVRAGLLLVGAIFAYGAWLGGHHAGVEWGWWPGPADCSAGAATLPESAGNLLSTLRTVRITPCDEAGWRFLGLSFAGYNALISTALAVIALRAAVPARLYGSSSLSQYR